MDKACYIYNMDETGMPLDHKQLKRVALRGMKKVHGLLSGEKKPNYCTCLFQCSGYTVLPMMVIFKGECLNYEWTKGEVPNTVYKKATKMKEFKVMKYQMMNAVFVLDYSELGYPGKNRADNLQ